MLIAKVENGQVLDVADYRAMFPGTSFPLNGPDSDFLAENSCMQVSVFKPYDLKTEKLVPASPYIDGQFVYTVSVEQKTQADLASDAAHQAASVRAERNRRLSDSDWTQLPDSPPDALAWGVYRKALRDLPSQPGFPWDIIWPEAPQ